MLQLSHVIFFLFRAQVLSQRSRAWVSIGSQAQSRHYLDVHRIFGNCVSQCSIQHIIGLALENIFQSVLPSIQCSGSDPRSIWPIHKFICSPAPYCNEAIHTESQLHEWTTIDMNPDKHRTLSHSSCSCQECCGNDYEMHMEKDSRCQLPESKMDLNMYLCNWECCNNNSRMARTLLVASLQVWCHSRHLKHDSWFWILLGTVMQAKDGAHTYHK